MFNTVITLVINLLSAVQWLERDEDLQRKILEIVRDQINLVLKPKPTVEDMRNIYEREGKIPAIKEWRTINDGMGLKDAKDAIENAACKYEWKDHRVGKRCTIFAPNSARHGETGEVSRVADNGFYVKFRGQFDDVFFHQSAVSVTM
jgi:hypothetical protein